MHLGNEICERFGDQATLARIGIQAILSKRGALSGSHARPAGRTAYILRQLKRPDEVALLRMVYGPQFVLISANGPFAQRKALLLEQMRQDQAASVTAASLSRMADELIGDDASDDKPFGQRLRDTFHLADVFIDGLNRQAMEEKLSRFIQALYGRADIGPSKEEFGMYAANSAALRSNDLSRQVGAVIFSPDGELISQGCNEAPKAFGGNYWDSESPDFRDVKIGHDPNASEIREVLRDLFERLLASNMLSETAKALGSPSAIVRAVTTRTRPKADAPEIGALANAAVLDLTEYGRVVHAEMNAICDAARTGRAVKGGILFCTTFPCHNCTKHILASGIKRVIYIEPYPKSRAKSLHMNEIEIDGENPSRVVFVPFMGISPSRYPEIFQKGRRKNSEGRARHWYHEDGPRPMVDVTYPAYLELEKLELSRLLGSVVSENNEP